MPYQNVLIARVGALGLSSWTDSVEWFRAAITVALQAALVVLTGIALAVTVALLPVLAMILVLEHVSLITRKRTRSSGLTPNE